MAANEGSIQNNTFFFESSCGSLSTGSRNSEIQFLREAMQSVKNVLNTSHQRRGDSYPFEGL